MILLLVMLSRVVDWGANIDHGDLYVPSFDMVHFDGGSARVNTLTGPIDSFDPARPTCLIAQSTGLHDIKAFVAWSINRHGTREVGLWNQRAADQSIAPLAPLDVLTHPSHNIQQHQFVEAIEFLEEGDCVFLQLSHTARKENRWGPGEPIDIIGLVPSFWIARR